MSTTVIFAELLIVGVQAIVWLFLVFLTIFGINWMTPEFFNSTKDWIQIITIFILAFAYTFGIIIDRLSDSILEPITQAIKKRYIDDSLPKINKMRLFIKTQSQPLNDYIDYIRSRQRIARSTAFNVLLIIIFLWILYFLRLSEKVDIVLILSITLCLLIIGVLSIYVWTRISQTYYKRLKSAYKIIKENENTHYKKEENVLEKVEQESMEMGGLKVAKLKKKPT